MIDLRFPLLGERIPADRAYLLYGALARLVPEFHHKESGLRFAPIRGDRFEKGLIQLTDRSHLVVRLPEERIRLALPLAGKSLSIGADRGAELDIQGDNRQFIPRTRTASARRSPAA